jgi:hypothetical protein
LSTEDGLGASCPRKQYVAWDGTRFPLAGAHTGSAVAVRLVGLEKLRKKKYGHGEPPLSYRY